MRVIFRADASATIGTGHVMRCLALADVLHDRGGQMSFVCRTATGDLTGLIEQRGYDVTRLPISSVATEESDAVQTIKAVERLGRTDWIVVDHYGLGKPWEQHMRATDACMMAIDDFVDRPHDVDLLLDQNLPVPDVERTQEMTPPKCLTLQGPHYALLRKEFAKTRTHLRKRDGALKTVLVYYGGSDPENGTGPTLEALSNMAGRNFTIEVVVGMSNPRRGAVETLCAGLPQTRFFCQVDTMAEIMARADFSFGAGGASSWERCCVGLPTAMTVLSPDQALVARALHFAGGGINLGPRAKMTATKLRQVVEELTPARLMQMEAVCLSITDGAGTNRVADAMAHVAEGKVP